MHYLSSGARKWRHEMLFYKVPKKKNVGSQDMAWTSI